jgi:cell division protein FtsQ
MSRAPARRLAIVAFGLLVVGTAAWMASRSPILDVDRIVVVGNARTGVDEVLAASDLARGDALVWLDQSAARDGVERLPWVREAAIAREWPDTVRITVEERLPAAWVDAGEGRALVVDRSGRVLAVESPAPVALPQLLDVTTFAEPGGLIRPAVGARIAGALTPEALTLVRTISATEQQASAVVASGQEVRLGRPTEIDDKMRAALAVLARPEVAGRSYVDVSAPSTPVAG